MSIPYRFRTGGLFRYENPDRHEKDVDEQAKRDARDESRLRVEKRVFWVGLFGLFGLLYTLCLTRVATNAATDQAKAALSALYSQRPYMRLGKADGTIAKYTAPTGNTKKGTIVLYFRNTGPVAAINFLTNVVRVVPSDKALFSQQDRGERHIERWQVWEGSVFPGQVSTGGDMVEANSIEEVVLDEKWTPTIEEWKLIDGGKSENSFSITGNLEYCDSWGKYHCEMFYLYYRPAPLSRFTAQMSRCLRGFPPLSDPSEIARADDTSATPLARCEQPEEREEKENATR